MNSKSRSVSLLAWTVVLTRLFYNVLQCLRVSQNLMEITFCITDFGFKNIFFAREISIFSVKNRQKSEILHFKFYICDLVFHTNQSVRGCRTRMLIRTPLVPECINKSMVSKSCKNESSHGRCGKVNDGGLTCTPQSCLTS